MLLVEVRNLTKTFDLAESSFSDHQYGGGAGGGSDDRGVKRCGGGIGWNEAIIFDV